ncbi:MAG TPA: glycosyltransferase family 2 protein [Bryobacteraceae bacterium]|nr:glycosyltransferase family 2 protein [Bryobacteraceae bacterium]
MQPTKNSFARGTFAEPVSVLLPVCDEVEGIEAVLAELVEVVYRHLPDGSEFLIEESGSMDGTKELLQEFQRHWPFLNIVFNDRREGFGAAAGALYRRATCPWVFFTDSDGQCVANEFWRLAEHAAGHDFLLGVKRQRYDPLMRRVTSRVFNNLARGLFGVPGKDINFGFRLARRAAVLQCLTHCGDLPTLLNAEVSIYAHALGFRILPVPVHHRPRVYGLSRGLTPESVPGNAWHAFTGLLRIREKVGRL